MGEAVVEHHTGMFHDAQPAQAGSQTTTGISRSVLAW